MTEPTHQDAGTVKKQLPKELYAVVVGGRNPQTGRKTKELLTFLSKVPARRLRDRVTKYRGEDGEVALLRASVIEWEEVE